MRLIVVHGDQRIKTFAHRCRQALGHALRQQRPGLVSGRPYRAAQHRIGRCENVLVAEPGARPRQQRGGPLEPQRLVLEEPRQPFSGGGIESAQTQVLADALLMLRDRLLLRHFTDAALCGAGAPAQDRGSGSQPPRPSNGRTAGRFRRRGERKGG